MRNTREIVRQKWLLKRPHRAISESVGVSVGAVSLALERATEAQLTWEGIEALDDAELEARLYPAVVAAALRPEPDCTWIHRERHRPGVTLELLHHELINVNYSCRACCLTNGCYQRFPWKSHSRVSSRSPSRCIQRRRRRPL
jgi:hypothetical protein